MREEASSFEKNRLYLYHTFDTLLISAFHLNISAYGIVLPNRVLIQLIFFKVFLKVFSLMSLV